MFENLILADIQERDLHQIARVHRASFPDSALSVLGPGAIRRYYGEQLNGDHVVALAIFLKDHIVGFGFGGVFHESLRGFLRKNAPYLVALLAVRPWLLRSPRLREQMLPAVSLLQRRRVAEPGGKKKNPPASQAAYFGILSIAVSPEIRRLGVGRMLMEEFARRAAMQGYEEMRLSVHTDNSSARKFYSSLGWEEVDSPGSAVIMRCRIPNPAREEDSANAA